MADNANSLSPIFPPLHSTCLSPMATQVNKGACGTMVSLMTVFVKLSALPVLRPFKKPCPSVLSSDYCSLSEKLSSLLTTLKLFTPNFSWPSASFGGQLWAMGNEQWAIGHMAYCGQLPVKWGRRSLWAGSRRSRVNPCTGPALSLRRYLEAAGNPVYVNHLVMNATVPRRDKVQALVAPLRRDSGVVRGQLYQVVPLCFPTSLWCRLCHNLCFQKTSSAHIGHPLGSCSNRWM